MHPVACVWHGLFECGHREEGEDYGQLCFDVVEAEVLKFLGAEVCSESRKRIDNDGMESS